MTANDLRRLAEHADGFRNQPLYLLEYWDGTVRKLKVAYESSGEAHVAVFTPSEGRPFREIDDVKLHIDRLEQTIYKNNKIAEESDVDSLFWTQSAAQKFLVPYYVSFYDKTQMDGLYAACTNNVADKDIYAIGHRFPTIYDEYSEGPPPGGPGGPSRASGPPRGPLKDVLVFWAFRRTSEVRVTSLGEFLDARRE